MALYRVQLRLAINTITTRAKWSNVFYVDRPSAAAAAAWGIGLWDAGWRLAHGVNTFCYEVYAADLAPATDNYVILPHGVNSDIYGAFSFPGEVLPLFNVIRVDFTMAAGRPSRKFVRGPLTEGAIQQDDVSTAYTTQLQAAFLTVANAGGVDPDGQAYTGYQIKGVTSRRLGKFAQVAVPIAPTVLPNG